MNNFMLSEKELNLVTGLIGEDIKRNEDFFVDVNGYLLDVRLKAKLRVIEIAEVLDVAFGLSGKRPDIVSKDFKDSVHDGQVFYEFKNIDTDSTETYNGKFSESFPLNWLKDSPEEEIRQECILWEEKKEELKKVYEAGSKDRREKKVKVFNRMPEVMDLQLSIFSKLTAEELATINFLNPKDVPLEINTKNSECLPTYLRNRLVVKNRI